MSVIRFMAKSMILRETQPQKVVRNRKTNQRHTMMFSCPSEFKTRFGPISPRTKERENSRVTEMTSHILKDLNIEMGILEKQHKMMSQQNESTFEIINKGREKLAEIQSSKSNNTLSEVVNMLLKRGESISTFLDQIQAQVNLQTKDSVQVQNFSKLRDHYEQEMTLRADHAKIKLNQLFEQYLAAAEQKRKQMMANFECQVKIDSEEANQQRIKNSSNNKKSGLNDQIKTLKAKNKFLQEQNSALKIFISQKTEQYQKTIAGLCAEKLHIQSKMASESKITSQIFNIGKKQNNGDNADNTSQIYSKKSCQSLNNDKKQNTLLAKRLKANININKPMKSKVQFHLSSKNLFICKLAVNLIANYPRVHISNQEYAEGQAFVQIQAVDTQQIQIKTNSKSNEIEYKDQYDHAIQQKNIQFEQKLVKEEVEQIVDELIEKQSKNPNEQSLHNKISLKKNIKSYFKNKRQFTQQIETKDCEHIVQGKKKQSIVHIYLPLQLARNSKILTEPNLQKIYLKTSNKISKFKQQQRQTSPTENQTNISISKMSNQKTMTKMINYSGETGKYKLKHQQVRFQEQDLINLFFNEGNAYNYELLNFSLANKANYYTTVKSGKNIVLKNVKDIADNKSKNFIADRQQQQESNVDDALINLVHKYLKSMKLSKKQRDIGNYHALKNFIRFPFSSINRREEALWKEHERQDYNLQYLQLKKYVKRIVRLHQCCKVRQLENRSRNRQSQPQTNSLKNSVCQHWKVFFMKLGINLFGYS